MEGLGLVAHPSVGQGVGWGNQHPPGAGDSPSGRSGCSGVLLKGLRWAWRKRASRSSDAIATVLLGNGHCLSYPALAPAPAPALAPAPAPALTPWHRHPSTGTDTITNTANTITSISSQALASYHQHPQPGTSTITPSQAPIAPQQHRHCHQHPVMALILQHGTDIPAPAVTPRHQHQHCHQHPGADTSALTLPHQQQHPGTPTGCTSTGTDTTTPTLKPRHRH